jgi:hypothetical protein
MTDDQCDEQLKELEDLQPAELSLKIFELAGRLRKAKGQEDYVRRLFLLARAGHLLYSQAAHEILASRAARQ